MRLVAVFLILVLGGCATGNLLPRSEPPVPEPVVPQTGPPAVSSTAPSPPSLSSPAARAAAAPDVTVSSSGLIPCDTQSCKINCSSKVPARARPKWCSKFEPPVEEVGFFIAVHPQIQMGRPASREYDQRRWV